MATVIQILNTGRNSKTMHRRWLQPGEPVLIGRQVIMSIYVDREVDGVEGEWIPVIEIQAPGTPDFRAPVPVESCVDATGWAGLYMLPRAVEIVDGRPERVLVEFTAQQEAGHRVG